MSLEQIKMGREENSDYFSLKCGISSFLATLIAGVLHPLDLIKTRFQSHDGLSDSQNLVPKYKGLQNALYEIYHKEGFRGLYKGFYISFASQSAATAFFFFIYETRKLSYEEKGYEKMKAVTLASIEGSIIATLVTQPIWVIKTRMLLNVDPHTRELSQLIKTVKQIKNQNGIKGFGKGMSLSLMLAFSGVLQMYLYEGSKIVYDWAQIPQSTFSQKNFICGGFSKVSAVLITYPFTTIRTRIQQNQFFNQRQHAKYGGIAQIVKRALINEGIRGFYKGVVINLAKGIPQRGIYFYFYEIFKKLLTQKTF